MIIPRVGLVSSPALLRPLQNKNETAAPQFLFELNPKLKPQEEIQQDGFANSRQTQIITRILCFKQDQQYVLFIYFKENRNHLRLIFHKNGGPPEVSIMDGDKDLKSLPECYDFGLPSDEIKLLSEKMKKYGFQPDKNFWSVFAPFNQSHSVELSLPAF